MLARCCFPALLRRAPPAPPLLPPAHEWKTCGAERFGVRLHRTPCRVVKVYDGDSYTILWRGGDGRLVYANSRLFGIDTPELRGSDREKAVACRDMARALLLGEVLCATTQGATGLDKYGRPLVVLEALPGHTSARVSATLAAYASCVNRWMLAVGPGCRPLNASGGAAPSSG